MKLSDHLGVLGVATAAQGTKADNALQPAPNTGVRNLLRNGTGRINQRSYSSGTATTVAHEYTIDGWRVVVLGEDLDFSGTVAGYTMTAPSGGVEQEVEDVEIAGGSYVLSWTGTATATVNGTARTSGEVFTLPAGTNAIVRFTGGTFTEAQLEQGSIVTPYEFRLIADELHICHRHLYVSVGTTWAADYTLDSYAIVSLPLPTVLRATPDVDFTAVTSSANTSWNGASVNFTFVGDFPSGFSISNAIISAEIQGV